MDPKEFEEGTPVKIRGVDVGFSVQDINRHYGTMTYRELDTGVPNLNFFKRYNEDFARELQMPDVVGPWDDQNPLLQHDLQLEKTIICAGSTDSLVMSFPVLITHFCEEAGRQEAGLRPVATKKVQKRDATKEVGVATEENLGAVPVGHLVTSLPRGKRLACDQLPPKRCRREMLLRRQTALEKGIADLTKAIQDSYLSALERRDGSGPSSEHDG
ncbi:hypothetical protein QYF36_023991 [Acer negundo]|nr:hypothetical protein QYF36_023991 [Acer negundo]